MKGSATVSNFQVRERKAGWMDGETEGERQGEGEWQRAKEARKESGMGREKKERKKRKI